MRLRTWILIGLVALLAIPAQAAGPDPDRLAGSSRREQDGWIFVHLEGPPERLGYQHGVLLSDEIADLLRVVKPYLQHTTKRDWAFYRKVAEEQLWRGVEPEYQREIDGIVAGLKAKGVEADRWDLVALNALEEVPYYYVPWLEKKAGKPASVHAPGNCSAFVATGSATKDGRIVMGHNLWTNYVTGTRWNIVFDLAPEHGERLIMDGLPGIITSDDDFAVNGAGILVTETTITQFEGWDESGKPEFSRSRKAMQYSRSIDDFVRIMLDGNNGGYANDWLLGDTKTSEIAQFELGLKHHVVRRTKDGYFVGSNFPTYGPLIVEETTFDVNKRDSSPNARRTRWDQLMTIHHGSIDIDVAKAMETDTFDVIAGKDEASERTLSGRVETSPRGVPEWEWGPFYPGGTPQVKVVDSAMAESLSFWGRIGHRGSDFIAADYLKAHPEREWMRPLLKDLRNRPWSRFEAVKR